LVTPPCEKNLASPCLALPSLATPGLALPSPAKPSPAPPGPARPRLAKPRYVFIAVFQRLTFLEAADAAFDVIISKLLL